MVNTYELKFTSLQQKILQLLLRRTGSSLNQYQIAQNLNVSQTAVRKSIPFLEENNLICMVQDKDSRRWSIELHRDNHSVLQLKRAENLKQLYATGLVDFLESECPGATIVLFGSYSRGEDIINSDVDIAIIGREEKNITLLKYENLLERKVSLHFFRSLDGIHKHLRESLFNGITLVGGFKL